MRRLELSLLLTLIGCSTPSSPTHDREPEPASESEPEPEAEPEPSTPADDPLLARARASMRRGRVAPEMRERLLASRDPDHRRAARLLQVIEGDEPAALLARADAIEPAHEPAHEPDHEPGIEPTPAPDPGPDPGPAPEVEPAPERPQPSAPPAKPKPKPSLDDETIDPLPKLSRLPPDGQVRAWFAGVEPEPEPAVEPAPSVDTQRIFGSELLLLAERPPLPAASDAGKRGDAPGLVILTGAKVRDGAEPGTAVLELVGAAAVKVHVQPLDASRVRLWLLDAGAVPSFLRARPQSPALEVLDVVRNDRAIEVELELAWGWTLMGIEPLSNGAAVQVARLDMIPGARPTTPTTPP